MVSSGSAPPSPARTMGARCYLGFYPIIPSIRRVINLAPRGGNGYNGRRDIVYMDKRILVAVKPAGVLSTDEPGGMPPLLRQEIGDEAACVRTVHRLDAAVGGLMVFARSARAAAILSEQMRNGGFHKEYLAVVHGLPEPEHGELRDLLQYDGARRMNRVVSAPGKGVQEAVLDYERLGEANGLSLVRVRLHTGRTHQIRVQFSARGWPLAGDRKYGQGFFDRFPIALWSAHLAFTHPESGKTMDFSLPPPDAAPWTQFGSVTI